MSSRSIDIDIEVGRLVLNVGGKVGTTGFEVGGCCVGTAVSETVGIPVTVVGSGDEGMGGEVGRSVGSRVGAKGQKSLTPGESSLCLMFWIESIVRNFSQ